MASLDFRPYTVRDAFAGLHDDPTLRVRLGPDAATARQMARVRPGRSCSLHHSHYRLSWTEPARTISKGGRWSGGAGAYHIWHPDEPRPITTAEVKRLGSFPDAFRFAGKVGEVFSQVGNGVPPFLMRAVAAHVRSLNLGDPPTMPNKSADYVASLEAAWDAHLAPRATDAPTVISLFAGGGGSSLGYSMAGYRELLAVEWDDNAVATFRLNFPDVPIYHGDIATLSVERCLELAGIAPGELDVLDGSPPCQGFSTAGKRLLDDPRNGLFREFVRLLRGIRPKAFVMENVSGMVKGKMKLVFAEILRELKASGYRVRARLLNAMYFGVPQSRQRMIFIGIRDDLEVEPEHPKAQARPIPAATAIASVVNETFNRPLAKVASAIWKHIKPGQNGTKYRANYYMNTCKVHPSRPCCTLPKVCSGTGATMHWAIPRTLTIEEAKRISSYPDPFRLIGSFTDRWARIGNSVPPFLARAIASHLLSLLPAPVGTA